MKVAIAGASGVLGRALIPQLIANGHKVRALARSPEKLSNLCGDEVDCRECDLLAEGIEARLPDLLAGCDAVIHAATAIPPQAQFGDPEAWTTNNRLRTEGTKALLAATLDVGADCYLQQSIAFAYPNGGDQWITEDMPLDVSSISASRTSTLDMEQQVRDVPIDHLRWCILRGGVFVGHGTFQDDTIADLRAGTLKVPCDGSSYQSLIHVEDMASAVVAAMERAPAGSIFNVVDEPLRQGDYLDRLADAIGAPKPARDGDMPCPPSYRCSNQAARDVLDWSPTHAVIPEE